MRIRYKTNYSSVTEDILLTIAAVGLIAIAATSPYFLINIARGIIKYKKYSKNKVSEENLARSLQRLKKNQVCVWREKKGKFVLELTDKGKRIAEELQFKNIKIKIPETWDKLWRIVIFDIPEKHKKRARDALRSKLKEWNFYQLQKSVWVCPYPCEKEIKFLCELFDVGEYVDIIKAKEISNDEKIRKYFHL